MKTNLTVEKNDPRLCLPGTDHLWSVVNRREHGNFSVADILAENVEHADAVMFAAAPDLLAALEDAEFLLRKVGLMAGPMRDSFNRSASDARDAIAKATGKGDA